MVSIAAFQAVDPGSIPGHRINLFDFEVFSSVNIMQQRGDQIMEMLKNNNVLKWDWLYKVWVIINDVLVVKLHGFSQASNSRPLQNMYWPFQSKKFFFIQNWF